MYVQCHMNVVLQDNYLHGVLVVKTKEQVQEVTISSGSLPRIRMTAKVLSVPQKTVQSDSMRMNETKKKN
jgi:hypothetical protein